MLAGYDLVYFASKDVTSADNDATARIPSYATSDICLAYAPSGGKFKGLRLTRAFMTRLTKLKFCSLKGGSDMAASANLELKAGVSYKF